MKSDLHCAFAVGYGQQTNCRIVHVPVDSALLSFILFVNLTDVPDVRKCVVCVSVCLTSVVRTQLSLESRLLMV